MASGEFDVIQAQSSQSGGDRLKIIDLSPPMFTRTFTFRHLIPGKVNRFLTLAYPFERAVWLYTLVALLTVLAAMYMLNLTSKEPVTLYQVFGK